MTRQRMGLDLVPAASPRKALGTARYVRRQTEALLSLDCPWTWGVVVTPAQAEEAWLQDATLAVVKDEACSSLRHGLWRVGKEWKALGCDAALGSAYFTPARRLPVLVNFFDSNVYERWERRKLTPGSILFRAALQMSVRKAERLFVLSDYCRERLSTVFPRYASKFVTVPVGCGPLADPVAVPPASWSFAGSSYCLFAGAFSDNKNQRGLLEAWRILQMQRSDLPQLVLPGRCASAYMTQTIRPLIAALPRPEEVSLPGFVSDAELTWLYTHATAYLHPAYGEGFGMPVTEAMLCGAPVACSNTSSLPETGGQAAVYFSPADPADMAAVIDTLLADPVLRGRLVEEGRQRARSFSWQKNAEVVAGHIEALLGRTARR